jgi:hypothetical protein
MADEPVADTSADAPENPGPDAVNHLLDLFVYAPLGFVVDARRVVPELAERGRAQAGVARMIGEFAVSWGNTKLQGAVVDAQEQAVGILQRLGVASPEPEPAAGAPTGDPTSSGPPVPPAPVVAPSGDTPSWLEGRTPEDEAEAAALAIPDYDNLSASQVVPRLDGLTPDELEAVRRYERKHRHRKTILNRVSQLQAGPA